MKNNGYDCYSSNRSRSLKTTSDFNAHKTTRPNRYHVEGSNVCLTPCFRLMQTFSLQIANTIWQ